MDAATLEAGLTFLGLVGLIEPPRPEAIVAVAECCSAGIRVKMITGDHAGMGPIAGASVAGDVCLDLWRRDRDILAKLQRRYVQPMGLRQSGGSP